MAGSALCRHGCLNPFLRTGKVMGLGELKSVNSKL